MTLISTDKNRFLCRIAGITYEIEHRFKYVKKLMKDYIIDSPDEGENVIEITYDETDIENACKIVSSESDAYIEFVCIFDKIASMLIDMGMVLMHGAAIEYDGQGYIFAAPSGTGKTTHINLWRKYLKDDVTVINGDKPELSFMEEEVMVHGAPWCGKEGWQTNKSVPLKGVCLISRGKENRIKQISPGEYIEILIRQFYFDFQSDDTLKIIDFINRMAERVPFYMLECDISEEAAKCSFEKLTGKEWRRVNED